MIAALAPLLFAVTGAISALVIADSLIGACQAWRALMDEKDSL
jgi:hypothetical protein